MKPFQRHWLPIIVSVLILAGLVAYWNKDKIETWLWLRQFQTPAGEEALLRAYGYAPATPAPSPKP